MARSENQKIKLLLICDILRTESDKDHPIGTKEIIARLADREIACGRKSLYSDMKLLEKYGYCLKSKRAKQNLYYAANRELDIHTIRFLIDATQSATFLSKNQTKEIVGNLAMLAGENKAQVLRDSVVCFDKLKHSNNEVLKTITVIDRAIEHKRKVSFEYYTINADGTPQLRTEAGRIKRYSEIPVAMVYSGGCYYLIVFLEKHNDFASFRIDRMRAVMTEGVFPDYDKYEQLFKNSNLKESMTAFGMWMGKTVDVKLKLLNRHAGDIFDKFGSKTKLHPEKDGRFTVTVQVNPEDPVFLGWCMSYGSELEIVSPDSVKTALLSRIEDICRMYNCTVLPPTH